MSSSVGQSVPAVHGAVLDLRVDQLNPVAARGFLRTFLGILLAALATVAALNYLINPQAIFSTHLLVPLTWNARAVKEQLLTRYASLPANQRPTALVLGSSRIMKIDPELIRMRTGLRAFNAGVNSATAEDDYVLLRHAIENVGISPRLVLIGVDVETFHDHIPTNDYLLQPNALGRLLQSSTGTATAPDWKKFTTLFTWYQTESSVLSLYLQAGGRKPRSVNFREDGFPTDEVLEGEMTGGHARLDANIQRSITKYAALYNNYSRISPWRLDYFEKTLDYLQQRGIPTIVFLTPMHPRLVAALDRYGYPSRLGETASVVSSLAARHGATYYDFSSTSTPGLDPNGFLDGVHMSEANSAQLANALLGYSTAVSHIPESAPATVPRNPHALQ